jgi:hypothetical protein
MKEEVETHSKAETERAEKTIDRKMHKSGDVRSHLGKSDSTFFDEEKLKKIQSNFNKTSYQKSKNHQKSNSTHPNFYSTFMSQVIQFILIFLKLKFFRMYIISVTLECLNSNHPMRFKILSILGLLTNLTDLVVDYTRRNLLIVSITSPIRKMVGLQLKV